MTDQNVLDRAKYNVLKNELLENVACHARVGTSVDWGLVKKAICQFRLVHGVDAELPMWLVLLDKR